jgi:hypothetical protein
LAGLGAALGIGCTSTGYRAEFVKPDSTTSVDATAQFLKCHMYDGSLYVLTNYRADLSHGIIAGVGPFYDPARNMISNGPQVVRLADIELLETNDPETVTHSGVPLMAVITGASLALTAVCLANPKACFGSCPTFYTRDETGWSLQAEGFSASVARAFESTDVDAMWTAKPSSRVFEVLMTNEALETHVVDSVRLVAAPRPAGGRVFRAGSSYYPARDLRAPTRCESPNGDCLADVAAIDQRAYLSPANEKDLSTKETLELIFPPLHGRSGIVVAARNSLLNTFLFYQGLAYMGHTAGDWFTRLNHSTRDGLEGFRAFDKLLGDIDVSVKGKDGTFRPVGSYSEVGPIAREVQLVVVPEESVTEGAPVTVRIVMTAGNWKLDYVGLADLDAPVTPIFLDPVAVFEDGKPNRSALDRLKQPGEHLVTYPRDAYTIRFDLPPGDHELFLESRGYYYEWIRKSWLPDESSWDLMKMLLDPEGAMRRLAPVYKGIEGDMERVFWESRMGHR